MVGLATVHATSENPGEGTEGTAAEQVPLLQQDTNWYYLMSLKRHRASFTYLSAIFQIQAYLGDTASSVPDHHIKTNGVRIFLLVEGLALNL